MTIDQRPFCFTQNGLDGEPILCEGVPGLPRAIGTIAYVLLLFVLFAQFAALPTSGQESQTRRTRPGPELIHFGDIIDVDVVGSLEFDWRGGLTPEGFLEGYDHLEEPIAALCRTEQSVADAISSGLSATLRAPNVTVRIIDRSNRAVAYIDGGIRIPQRLRINRPVRLNEVIAVSGGITDTASGEITIFRRSDLSCQSVTRGGDPDSPSPKGEPETVLLRVSIAELLRGNPDANPYIVSGDIVSVLQAQPVYVIGGVNNPRMVSSRTELTVARAILSAGGIAKGGIADSVTIYRRSDGQRETIETSFRRIQLGETEDVPLKPFDIVDVGQKGVSGRRFPPMVEAMPGSGGSRSRLPLRIID